MVTFTQDFQEDIQNSLLNVQDISNTIRLILEDGSLEVNKLLLVIGSDTLREILTESQNTSVVILPDVNIDFMQKVIRVIGSGEIFRGTTEKEQDLLRFISEVFCLDQSEWFQKNISENIIETFQVKDKTVCKICCKRFKTKQTCKRHEKHCKSKVEIECDQCDKRFKTKFGLISHKRSKHMASHQVFECEDCDCKYKNLSDLKRHCIGEGHIFPKEHGPLNEDETKFKTKCSVCHKRVQPRFMKDHMETYHNDKFNCDHCDYTSVRKDNLYRHIKLKHGLINLAFAEVRNNFKKKKDITYRCPECKKMFFTVRQVEDHLQLKDCKDIHCDICKKTFTLYHNLKQHKLKFHNTNK